MENIAPDKQTIIRVLFLASSPKNQGNLRLGSELQEIRNRLSNNTSFEIRDRQAVKPDDVLQTILNYKPHIVHFSGHGQDTGEICFEDEKGDSKTIPPDALASLFKLANDNVKCVVINTCFSEKQAKAISQFIPIVIGTKKEITDSAAIKFSTGFYTGLDPDLSQKNLLKAFDSGCIAIRFESLAENLTPILIQGSPEVRFSSEVDTAFLSISKPEGFFFTALQRGLTLIGIKLGVSEDVVARILQEKKAKVELHNRSMVEYETYLKDILRDEYPLSDSSTSALLLLQNGLDLNDEDVVRIKNKILSDPGLDKAEKWYDRGRGQSQLNNYEQAITYFSKAIEKDSDYSGAFFERGICYDKLGEFELAIDDYTNAIKFNNKWDMVINNLGLAYFYRARAYDLMMIDDEAKQMEIKLLALDDWNKSIEINPLETQAYYGRGLVYDKLNKINEALADFMKTYEMTAPEKVKTKKDCIIYIRNCYYKLNKFEDGAKWAKLLLKETPDEPVTDTNNNS